MQNNVGFTTRAIQPSIDLDSLYAQGMQLNNPSIMDIYNTPLNDLMQTPTYSRTVNRPNLLQGFVSAFEQPAQAAEPELVYDRVTGQWVSNSPSPEPTYQPTQVAQPTAQEIQEQPQADISYTPSFVQPTEQTVEPEQQATVQPTQAEEPSWVTIPVPDVEPSQIMNQNLGSFVSPEGVPYENTDAQLQEYLKMQEVSDRNLKSAMQPTEYDYSKTPLENSLSMAGNVFKFIPRLGTGMMSAVPMANAVGIGFNQMTQPWNPLWKRVDTPDDDLTRRMLLSELGQTWKAPIRAFEALDTTGAQPLTWARAGYSEGVRRGLLPNENQVPQALKSTVKALNTGITPEEAFESALIKTHDYPTETALDVLAIGALVTKPLQVASKTAQATTKVETVAEAVNKTQGVQEKAATLVNLSQAEVSVDLVKPESILKKLNNYSKGDIVTAIKAAEEGLPVTDKLLKIREDVLKPLQNVYEELVKKYSPTTYEDAFTLALKQLGVRRNLGNFSEVEKALNVYLENADMFSAPTRLKRGAEFYYDLLHEVTGLGRKAIDKKFGKLKFQKENTSGAYGTYSEDGTLTANIEKIAEKGKSWEGTAGHEITHKLIEVLQKVDTPEAKEFLTGLKRVLRPEGKLEAPIELGGRESESISWAYNLLNGEKVLDKYNTPMTHAVAEFLKDKLMTTKGTARVLTENGKNMLSAMSDDVYAKLILDAEQSFKKGDLLPVPHTDAGVDRLLGEGSGINRAFAGKYSQRALGTATYEEIADTLLDPNKWIYKQTQEFTDANIVRNLNQGAGASKLGSSDAVYISADNLREAKDIKDVAGKVTPAPVGVDSVALDKNLVNATNDYMDTLRNFGAPYKPDNALNIWYNINKSVMLATGKYLAGNISSGALNAAINSNIHLIDDIMASFRTGGELAKATGTYRHLTRLSRDYNKVDKLISSINKPLSNAFNVIDSKAQNLFAETALNASLREAGIPINSRASFLREADKMELAKLITNAQDVAALQTGFSIVPKMARGAVATMYPFYRWTDTALRSTAKTWANHPIISNLVFNKALGEIAFNQEMQHRLDIKADLDKPFVHIKFNPNTGKYRDVSMDYSPQTTSMRFLGETAEALGKGDLGKAISGGKDLNPIGYAAFNVFKGVDKYGKPIYRDKSFLDNKNVYMDYKNNTRYTIDEQTGKLTPLTTQGDEVLTQAISETLVYPRFINSTVLEAAQLVNNMYGNDLNYYRPAANRLFGTFDPTVSNIKVNNPITPDVALSDILGMYSTSEYNYPNRYDSESPSGRDARRIIRGRGRQVNRNVSNIQRQLGGE